MSASKVWFDQNWCLVFTRLLSPWFGFLEYKGKGRFKKKREKNEWIYPFGLAGWGQQRAKIQPKKNCLKKKYKDDQNCIIHPEN